MALNQSTESSVRVENSSRAFLWITRFLLSLGQANDSPNRPDVTSNNLDGLLKFVLGQP